MNRYKQMQEMIRSGQIRFEPGLDDRGKLVEISVVDGMDGRLRDTPEHHDDLVHSISYAVAAQEARVADSYVLLHLKKKPWWLPAWAWEWLLGELLILTKFKR